MQRASNRTTRLMAGFLFFGATPAFRPDVRHWADDLFQASPHYAAYEDFLSPLDLDDSMENLEAAAAARQQKIAALEALDKKSMSAGQIYHNDKLLVDLLLEETTYLQFKAQRGDYLKSGAWRRPERDPKAASAHPELSAISFKTLELTRSLVNNSSFDGPENMALLVRLLGRVHNDNIVLFAEQFKKKFPLSPLLAQVQHSLAEYYAAEKSWDKAEAQLKAAMENKESTLRPFTVYKLGWVHLAKVEAEKDTKKRADALKKANAAFRLSLKLMDDWKAYKPVFDLKREVRTDIAWLMAESRVAKADAQNQLKDQPLEYQAYLSYLAIDAARDGDFALSRASFNEVLPLEMKSRDLPRLLLNYSEMQLLSKDYNGVLDGYTSLRYLFTDDSPWSSQWKNDKELEEVSRQQLGKHIADSAARTYREAEKMAEAAPAAVQAAPILVKNDVFVPAPPPAPTPRRQLFNKSKELYGLYASWYPKGEALQEARFNEALSHFYTGEYEKSLDLLSSIAAEENNSFRQQASYNGVLVALNYDQQQAPPRLPESGKAKAPIPFSKSRGLLVQHIESFLASYPDADERVTLQYMAAQSYYEYGHYPEALKRFDAIVLSSPETEQGESSLHTMLGYQVEAGQWTEVIARCETYLKNKAITGAGHRKILRQTLQYAKGQVGT